MTNDLNRALLELGLSASECEFYLISLAFGPLTIPVIAKKLGLQRPYIYTLIRTLREKGLAPLTKGYQRTFIVESPTVVLELLRKKRQTLELLTTSVAAEMPTFLASYRQGGARTQVLFYEGKEKFLELYNRILVEEEKETLYFGEAANFFQLLGQESVSGWVQQRIQKKITIRTLMPDGVAAQSIPSDASVLRETRVIDSRLTKELPASFQIFGKSVIFWQSITPVAVVLQDEYLAKLMRTTFELIWSQGVRI